MINEQLIRDVIQQNDLDGLSSLITGADASDVDRIKHTALSYTLKYGKLDCLKLLIEVGGIDFNSTNRYGYTSLTYLSKSDADAKLADISHTHLTYLLDADHAELVSTLVKAGANPDMVDRNSHTPLSMAAFEGRLQFARALIEAGADVNACDGFGITPIKRLFGLAGGTEAPEEVKEPFFKLLLSCGSEIPDGLEHFVAPAMQNFVVGCINAQESITTSFAHLDGIAKDIAKKIAHKLIFDPSSGAALPPQSFIDSAVNLVLGVAQNADKIEGLDSAIKNYNAEKLYNFINWAHNQDGTVKKCSVGEFEIRVVAKHPVQVLSSRIEGYDPEEVEVAQPSDESLSAVGSGFSVGENAVQLIVGFLGCNSVSFADEADQASLAGDGMTYGSAAE